MVWRKKKQNNCIGFKKFILIERRFIYLNRLLFFADLGFELVVFYSEIVIAFFDRNTKQLKFIHKNRIK